MDRNQTKGKEAEYAGLRNETKEETVEIQRGTNKMVYEKREARLKLQVRILLLPEFRYKITRFGLEKSFRR